MRARVWQGFVHDYPGEDVATLVTCFNSFEHDFHWRETVTRLIELLKPGGLFVFQLICSGVEHGNIHPTEPYGTKMEDGTYYYKNVDVDQFTKYTLKHQVVLEKSIKKAPGDIIVALVDNYNKPFRTPEQHEVTRHTHYLIGRKV